MTLFVIRHAHAGSRSAWQGDDRIRPLSTLGSAQAEALAGDVVSRGGVSELWSSPARRCVDTLVPLARVTRADVQQDDRLFEGPRVSFLDEFLDDVLVPCAAANRSIAISSHGDVVPIVLRLLVDRGMPDPGPLAIEKAAMFVVPLTADELGPATYVAPPAVSPTDPGRLRSSV